MKTIISEVRKQISSNKEEIEIKFIPKLEEDEIQNSICKLDRDMFLYISISEFGHLHYTRSMHTERCFS